MLDFDEDWYLSTYPDVEEAVRAGKFASGWAHFRADGYLEGRLGSQPAVDEEWYLSTYPDIANAVLQAAFPAPRITLWSLDIKRGVYRATREFIQRGMRRAISSPQG